LKASEQEGLGFCIPLDQLRRTIEKAVSQTDTAIGVAQSNHRIRVVFAFVSAAGEAYKNGMNAYTLAMELALERRLRADVGLEAIRETVQASLSVYDQAVLRDLRNEVPRISTDKNLSEAVRQKFVELWTNYLEFKSYVDTPHGTFNSYKTKFYELSDKHDRLAAALKLLLGDQDSGA
jgi:hypothetical protein